MDNMQESTEYEVTTDAETGEQTVEEVPSESEQVEEGEYTEDEAYTDEYEDETDEGTDESELDEEATESATQAIEEANTVAEVLNNIGIDLGVLNKEYAEMGHLSEASYQALQEAGYPRVLVDSFCAGQQAQYDQWVSHVKSMAGGEEAYDELMQYASATLTQNEKNMFDEAVNSGSAERARFAVDALLARYNRDNPYDGYEYEGSDSYAEPPIRGYLTPDEMYEAMESPEMADPTFRAIHEARLMRTSWLKD